MAFESLRAKIGQTFVLTFVVSVSFTLLGCGSEGGSHPPDSKYFVSSGGDGGACRWWCDSDRWVEENGKKHEEMHCGGGMKDMCGSCSYCGGDTGDGEAPTPGPALGPAPPTPPTPSAGGVSSGKCGFACKGNDCNTFNSLLGHTFPFYQYGGACSLNLFAADGYGTTPDRCNGNDFFLWDEPFTQSQRGKPEWGNMDHIVAKWKEFASKHSSSLISKRNAGMKVTTPMFTGGETVNRVSEFFQKCGGGCNDKSSPEYIDVIAWNSWIGDWNGGNHQGQTDWTVQTSNQMKSAHGGREVFLSNWGFLGSTGTPEKQADSLTKYGIIGKVDRVYYFAAPDVGGGTTHGSNSLQHEVIRNAFLSECL